MDIITAVRKLCEGKNAFRDLFDKTKTYDKLLALADDKQDAELFGALLYRLTFVVAAIFIHKRISPCYAYTFILNLNYDQNMTKTIIF